MIPDVLGHYTHQTVFIEVVWRTALESGANVLALNIIESARGSDVLIQKRASLNKSILEHNEERL